MLPGFPLLTARLVRRRFEAGDLADLFAYLSRAEVARYFYAERLTDRGQAEQDLRRKMTADLLPEEHQTLVLAMVWPPAERVIGDVMLHYSSHPHKQGEIGYVLNRDYHGQGFASEAA